MQVFVSYNVMGGLIHLLYVNDAPSRAGRSRPWREPTSASPFQLRLRILSAPLKSGMDRGAGVNLNGIRVCTSAQIAAMASCGF